LLGFSHGPLSLVRFLPRGMGRIGQSEREGERQRNESYFHITTLRGIPVPPSYDARACLWLCICASICDSRRCKKSLCGICSRVAALGCLTNGSPLREAPMPCTQLR
jgi:hypothetical protein